MIPPDANASFVAAMEDVLETYRKPRDPERPLVCVDETSKQLIVETRTPISAKPGRVARHDYQYERNGVANLFMMFAPLEGWREVEVTDRHAAVDYAHDAGVVCGELPIGLCVMFVSMVASSRPTPRKPRSNDPRSERRSSNARGILG